MPVPMVVVCDRHSPAGDYCYVQRDGSHMPQSACTCGHKGRHYDRSQTVPEHFVGARYGSRRDGGRSRVSGPEAK